jgi:integrase
MQMAILVRTRNHGKSYELRIIHDRLEKPIYRTLDTREDAERIGVQALQALDRGESPGWLLRPDQRPFTTIGEAIRAYLAIGDTPASTERLLDTLNRMIGARRLADVDYAWAEAWIHAMKIERHSTPGTIRKKKGALSAVLAWVTTTQPLCLASNPLQLLRHGYSGYGKTIRTMLIERHVEIPEDIERGRRIDREEQSHIVQILEERLGLATSIEHRARIEALSLMFQLAICTAMRMREIYTLTEDQVQPELKTIFLKRTKNGDNRQVPLNSHAIALLRRQWPALAASREEKRMFPFWRGSTDPDVLRATTSEVSKLFAYVFCEALSEDLYFHDTRHEAVCRWVLEAPLPLTSEFLARAAGMRNARTRQRYLSLRGSELADQLG